MAFCSQGHIHTYGVLQMGVSLAEFMEFISREFLNSPTVVLVWNSYILLLGEGFTNAKMDGILRIRIPKVV